MSETKLRILHIEDSSMIIDLTKEMLKEYYYKSAKNIVDGLKTFKKERFDLIILDLRFESQESINGVLPGFFFLENLKKDNVKVKVVILSALSEQSKKAMSDYPDIVKGVVNKPFIKKQLLNAIKKATNK